jgi:hypothetical protein
MRETNARESTLPPAGRSVLGVNVHPVDYRQAVECVLRAASRRQSLAVTALAVHGVMTGVLDREHNYRLNQFDLVCPDGQPVRWALNGLHGARLGDRVYGPELMLRVAAACAERDLPIFLFGGTSEMLEALAARLVGLYPGLRIAGQRASRFRQLERRERDALAEEMHDSGAAVCFVGIGCPRQETFVYEMRSRVRMPMLAVGAAFAFHAGMLPQAPAWMQRRGLEWLYRFTREPSRLWRRYLLLNPLFLALLAAQYTGIHRAATDRGRQPRRELLFG